MLVVLDGTEGLFSKGLTSSSFAKFIVVHPHNLWPRNTYD